MGKLFSDDQRNCKNYKCMRKQFLIVFSFCLLTLIGTGLHAQTLERSTVVESQQGKNYYIHTVEQGQTLYAISKVYELPVDEIIFENPEAADGISIGQSLRIPVVSREKQISAELRSGEFRFIYHIVKKGETLFSISRIYDVPVGELKEINPEWEAGLSLGQYIKIPMKVPELEKHVRGEEKHINSSVHIVGAGETLYSISRKYKVAIPDIKALNPGITNNLSVGQQVIIPQLDIRMEEIEEDEEKFYEHTVASKETLYGIAKKYRISIDSLMMFNEGLSKNIYPGEVIRIPIKYNTDDYITHQVREKTKLKKLASKYALSVSAMKSANPGFRSTLRPGDLVRIPIGPPPALPPDDLIMVIDKPDDIPPSQNYQHDSILCFDRQAPYDGEIKVALMIPFYAEEYAEINSKGEDDKLDAVGIKSFNFIQFYEGFLMAMEDLESQGLKVRLYVYDVDDNVSKTIQVLQQPELPGMDLIIGPFFSRNFKLVSNFAEMYEIKIVNPLTRRNEVLNNPYVYKMKPSRDAQKDILVDFVENYYADANIILLRNYKTQFADENAEIKASLDKIVPYGVSVANQDILDLFNEYAEDVEDIEDAIPPSKLNIENRLIEKQQMENTPLDSTFFSNGIQEVIYAGDSVAGIIRSASVIRKNLVIVLSNNEIYTPDILTRLNDLKDTFDITVVGMPEWELLSNLETDYLLGLKVYFFTDSYYDYDDQAVLDFISDFRYQYKTHPNSYAYGGYDIATYFLGAMLRFGPDCSECIPYYNKELLKTSVNFSPAFPAGYENLYWNFCRYFNYKVIRVE